MSFEGLMVTYFLGFQSKPLLSNSPEFLSEDIKTPIGDISKSDELRNFVSVLMSRYVLSQERLISRFCNFFPPSLLKRQHRTNRLTHPSKRVSFDLNVQEVLYKKPEKNRKLKKKPRVGFWEQFGKLRLQLPISPASNVLN